MRHRVRSLAWILGLALVCSAVAPAQDRLKELRWTHGFDLACRKLGESEFSPSTRKFGVEALRDSNTGLGMYVSETGSITLADGFANLTPPIAAKGPIWVTGLDLPARKAGENEFTKTTTIYPLEIFRDPNVDSVVFVTSNGLIASAPARGKVLGGNIAPKWVHSVDLNVRKGGVKDWKDASKIGLEIYRDGNTGSLVYISQSGAIAVVPEATPTKPNDKSPVWLHGLDLSVRKFDEPTFTNKTRKFGVEVFRDETNGNLIYLCETGSLGVLTGGETLAAPTADVKEPTWSHGWNVKARKFGEKEFSERTQTFGGEVFRDENTGAVLAISDTGALSVHRVK